MLLYAGMGLLLAGIIMMFFAGRIMPDAEKAAKARKQAPILAVVGGFMLLLRFLIG